MHGKDTVSAVPGGVIERAEPGSTRSPQRGAGSVTPGIRRAAGRT